MYADRPRPLHCQHEVLELSLSISSSIIKSETITMNCRNRTRIIWAERETPLHDCYKVI